MLHSSSTCFSLLHYTCNTVSSITPRQLILTGRIFSTQTNFGKDGRVSNTSYPVRSFISGKGNCKILSGKNNFSQNKLFSTSSTFRGTDMDEFALAKKYKGSDYNVWWVYIFVISFTQWITSKV